MARLIGKDETLIVTESDITKLSEVLAAQVKTFYSFETKTYIVRLVDEKVYGKGHTKIPSGVEIALEYVEKVGSKATDKIFPLRIKSVPFSSWNPEDMMTQVQDDQGRIKVDMAQDGAPTFNQKMQSWESP